MKKAVFFSIILMIISCQKSKDEVYEELTGNWAIHNITYNGVDYKNHIFSMNIIKVGEDKKMLLPEVDNFKKDKSALWDFNYEKDSITFFIKSENKIFNGTYGAEFSEFQLTYKLILKSENLYLELYKL